MRLVKTYYGYRCASDRRLQFHGRVEVWAGPGRYFTGGWEVRLNGRRGNHYFKTLAEATGWARGHWQPFFLSDLHGHITGPGLCLWDGALSGDRLALLALLDWLEESGVTPFRDHVIRMADQYGLSNPRQRRQATAAAG